MPRRCANLSEAITYLGTYLLITSQVLQLGRFARVCTMLPWDHYTAADLISAPILRSIGYPNLRKHLAPQNRAVTPRVKVTQRANASQPRWPRAAALMPSCNILHPSILLCIIQSIHRFAPAAKPIISDFRIGKCAKELCRAACLTQCSLVLTCTGVGLWGT